MNNLEFSSFVVEPHNFRLFKQGYTIKVEPQVFETLLLLIEKRRRVVTNDELLEKIWQGRVVSNHVITRVIYQLRKILDNKSERVSHIRTVRGKGYQFTAEVEIIKTQKKPKFVASSHSMSNPIISSGHKFKWVVGLVALAVIGIVFISQYTEQLNSSTIAYSNLNPQIYPVVSVASIEVEASNEELSRLVYSLTDNLSNQLALQLNMNVIHQESLVNINNQFDHIGAIQTATRSGFLIQGFIESMTDQSINLHLNLYKSDDEQKLMPFSLSTFEFPYPKSPKELNDLNKQWKIIIGSIIEINKPKLKLKNNGDSETDDREAYRLVVAQHPKLINSYK